MRFGVRLPQDGPFASAKSMIKVAREAESLGYSCVWLNDHVNWDEHEKYHLSAGTKEAVDASSWEQVVAKFDCMETLAYVAGICPNIMVGSAALVLPIRPPLALARAAITLQELSGGRFIMGVCAGNLEHEAELHGYDYEERGPIMEENLQILTEIFATGKVGNYHGKYYKCEDGTFFPKPSKKIPIWYAGMTRGKEITKANAASLRRTAKYCDAIFPGLKATPESYKAAYPMLEEYCKKYGKSLSDIGRAIETFMCIKNNDEEAFNMTRATATERGFKPEENWVFIGTPSRVARNLEGYKPVGVEDFEFKFMVPTLDEMITQMRRFAAEVMPSFT